MNPPPDDWMDSVRRRTHDHANRLMTHQLELSVFSERLKEHKRRLDDLTALEEDVQRLETQATVLRWLLATVTATAVAVVARWVV